MRSLEEYLNGLIGYKVDEPYREMARIKSVLISMRFSIPDELNKFEEFRDALEAHKTTINNINLSIMVADILNLISEEIEVANLEKEASANEKQEAVIQKIEDLRDNIIKANKEHNDALRSSDKSANKVWDEIEAKKESLAQYQSRVYDYCSDYGILTNDIEIPKELLLPERLNSLYDSYAAFLQKEDDRRNPIEKFRNAIPDTSIQGIVLLVAFVLSLTPVLSIVSVIAIAFLIKSQLGSSKEVEYYSLLAGLLFTVNPKEFKTVTYDESDLLPEEISDEEVEEDERFAGLLEELDNLENEEEEIKETSSPLISEFEGRRKEFEDKIDETMDRFNSTKAQLNAMIAEIEEATDAKEEELLNSRKEFGTDFNMSLSMRTKYILGEDNFEFEVQDYGDTNLIIRPALNQNDMRDFIRVLAMNALMNVSPLLLEVNVYDPNGMGQDLMVLYHDDFKNVFKVYSDALSEPMDELTEYAQANLYELQGRTIREYNEECEKTGKTPKPYRLLIILSQPKTMEEDEALLKFLEYSVKTGVLIWVISDKLNSNHAKVIRKTFDGVSNPIRQYASDAFCRKFVNNYAEAIKNKPRASLDWDSFVQNICPSDKRWIKDTSSMIELYPGYKNGDPNEPTMFSVGHQGNVHALGAGSTGAGKSAFLNHLIATLTWMYSPRDLELWLADFKGSEFNYYLGTTEYPQRYPHMRACLCTSDGDYAQSLFSALEKIGTQRYAQMQDTKLLYPDEDHPNFKSLQGFNRYWEALAEKETDPVKKQMYIDRKWPQIFFVCDEFAVIYNKASQECIEVVNRAITSVSNVARACGVHLLFTSQNMDGTVSATTLKQFSLRFGLRMDSATSMDIMGTKCSSTILEKNGFLYVRSEGIKPEDYARYKIPYVPDEDKPGKPSRLRQHIVETAKMAEERGIKPYKLISYLESTEHPIDELYALYENEKIKDALPDSGMFFLGERMAYEENDLPHNIQVSAVNNTNIYAGFEKYNDLVLFFNTIMGNLSRHKNPGVVFINTQVADLSYITEAENYISKDNLKKYLSEKNSTESIYKWVKEVYEKRKAKNSKDTPLWIILMGWNKGIGIGIDPDANLKRDLVNLMQVCGEFNMHFIFLSTNTPMGMSNIVDACKYRIAGKVTEDDSRLIIGNKRAGIVYEGKMAEGGYIFVNTAGVVTRDKLYRSEIKHQVKSDKLVLNL